MVTIEETTKGRPAREVLVWSRDLVDPALRAAVDRLPASMRRIAGYHLGWWDEHGHPAAANGARRSGQRSPCSPPRPLVATRQRRCPPRSRWSWCTTSPCCTTT